MSYETTIEAKRDAESCMASDVIDAMDALTTKVHDEIVRDVLACTELGDLSKGFVTAGDVCAMSRKSREVAQPVRDALLDAVIDNPANLKLLSELIASPAGEALRKAFAQTHASINASLVAEARGL